MNSRMNGYETEREFRPSSEQMVDLHVYLVPPDIWREKFNNALNQNINDTVSVGFIRVHPETKVYQLRDEIEQQLGSDIVPREYVFLKSVGRSLTRLKSRQETTLKAKSFLPPQAYAPELYLLEATPEVRQALAASSEGSTRPQTRTSYDYDPYIAKQSDAAAQSDKTSNTSNGMGHHKTLPHISPRISPRNLYPASHQAGASPRTHRTGSPHTHRTGSPRTHRTGSPHTHRTGSPRTHRTGSARTHRNGSPPQIRKTSATPLGKANMESVNMNQRHKHGNVASNAHELDTNANKSNVFGLTQNSGNGHSDDRTNSESQPNTNRSQMHLSVRVPSTSDTPLDASSSQHHVVASSPRQRVPPTEEYLPPLSATPPYGAGDKHKSAVNHGGANSRHVQHKHDEDSGVTGLTLETYRENDVLDRRKSVSEEENEDRLKAPSPERVGYGQDDKSPDNGEEDEWERRRLEEQERLRREEEERRQREEEEQRRRDEENARLAEEAKRMKSKSDEDLTQFPSPPPLRLASPDRDTKSARDRRRKEKEELMKELAAAKEARRASERFREDLVKQAKSMQMKTQNSRNHARDLWKKRYFEEKKRTGPLEEQTNRLRHELDIIHKRLLTTLEGPKEKATKLGDIKPSSKVGPPPRATNNFKIQATRLQHEIEDVRRRVDHAKMRLTGEVKLRNQAETELRALRAELTQKKINLTLSRNSHLTTYAPPAADVNFMTARSAITPRS